MKVTIPVRWEPLKTRMGELHKPPPRSSHSNEGSPDSNLQDYSAIEFVWNSANRGCMQVVNPENTSRCLETWNGGKKRGQGGRHNQGSLYWWGLKFNPAGASGSHCRLSPRNYSNTGWRTWRFMCPHAPGFSEGCWAEPLLGLLPPEKSLSGWKLSTHSPQWATARSTEQKKTAFTTGSWNEPACYWFTHWFTHPFIHLVTIQCMNPYPCSDKGLHWYVYLESQNRK